MDHNAVGRRLPNSLGKLDRVQFLVVPPRRHRSVNRRHFEVEVTGGDDPPGQHYTIMPLSTVLHELANAWSFEHMSSTDRDEFIAHRGLDAGHHDGAWWHMGQEQAAEIIAWVLGGDRFVSGYVEGADCTELAAAYTLMTEASGPHC